MAWTTTPFDPFATLGIERNAAPREIKARYRNLARRYHPNRNIIDPENSHAGLAERFYQINQAWQLLCADDHRRRHIEMLQLFDLHEAVTATFADLVQAGETNASATTTPDLTTIVDGPVSSDADDDEDLPRAAGVKRRATFDDKRNLHRQSRKNSDVSEEVSSDGAATRTRKIRFSGVPNEGCSGNESGSNYRDSAAQRRKQYEKLRKKELDSFYEYQEAMLDKFEAEEQAEHYRKCYEQAKWRREYFERAPRDSQARVKLARMMNNVAKAFRSLQPPRRRSAFLGTLPEEDSPSATDAIDPKHFLGLPRRPRTFHRRGWSTDISGDQTSSDEDANSSDRGNSPIRPAQRAQSPHLPARPAVHPARRQSSGPKLVTDIPRSLLSSMHDPISPITGPIKVHIIHSSSLRDSMISAGSDADTASASSKSGSSSPAPPEPRNFTYLPSSSIGDLVNRDERKSRSASADRRSALMPRGHSPTPTPHPTSPPAHHHHHHHSASVTEPVHFMIKTVGQLKHRNIRAENVHVLTMTEKKWMLGVEPDVDMDPRRLWRHLSHLDMHAARTFMVKPDIKAKFNFRLIYNHREVVKYQHQTFIALSYRRKIHVKKEGDHFTLPLEPEMFQAVWDERQSDMEGVWIDQICIDCDSDEEKTISMSAMDMVYRSARLVVVALDDILLEAREGSLLASHMEEFDRMLHVPPNKRFRRKQPPYLESHDDLSKVINKILTSSWFRRAWCRHEMRLAREHIFLIPCKDAFHTGKSIIRFTSKCLTHLLGLATEVPSAPVIESAKPALYAFFRDRSKLSADEFHMGQHHGNFTTVVAEVFAMEAGGDPRIPEEQRAADARKDKISIILNTMECGLTLHPSTRDIKVTLPTHECHYILLMLALAARDPGALSALGHPLLQLPSASGNGRVTSTWLFEPTNVDSGLNNYRTLNRLPKHCHIATGNDNGHHYVNLALKFVGDSGKGRAHLPHTLDTLDQARKIMTYCTKERLGRNRKRYLTYDKTANNLFGRMNEVYINTLACVLACGPDWIEQVCQRYGVSRWKQDLQGALELVIALKNTDGRWPESAWNSQAAGFIMDFVNFLIIRGMPQRQITSPESWGPIWTSPPAGGKVITFVPPGDIRAAVPQVLLDTDYIHLARLWVLEPRDEYIEDAMPHHREWTLRGKSVLFSDDAAIEQLSAPGGMVREHQKVFGRTPPAPPNRSEL